MRITFLDLHNGDNPNNGQTINDPTAVIGIVASLRSVEPSLMCQLVGDNGYNLTLGVGRDFGCVQHAANNGQPPYLMAVVSPADERPMEFLVGDTATPIDGKYRLPFDAVTDIVATFASSGQRSEQVRWIEFEPQ